MIHTITVHIIHNAQKNANVKNICVTESMHICICADTYFISLPVIHVLFLSGYVYLRKHIT